MTGHADKRMVRYYNNDTVLINHYDRTVSENFKIKLKRVLKKGRLHAIEIPYPSAHSNSQSADGLYINFLRLKGFILLPIFEFAEDEKAIDSRTTIS